MGSIKSCLSSDTDETAMDCFVLCVFDTYYVGKGTTTTKVILTKQLEEAAQFGTERAATSTAKALVDVDSLKVLHLTALMRYHTVWFKE